MEDKIRHLDDAAAIHLLSKIAEPHLHAGELETKWAAELRQALMYGSGIFQGMEAVSEGDLARQTLLLLAEDPATRQALFAWFDEPAMKSFGTVTILFALTAALVVLQTRFEAERDKSGNLSWKIGKEAVESKVLKTLIEKVLGFPLGK